MGEIVNLRRFKKRLARHAADRDAAVARAQHGRTRTERDAEAKAQRARDHALDGALLDGSTRNGEPRE